MHLIFKKNLGKDNSPELVDITVLDISSSRRWSVDPIYITYTILMRSTHSTRSECNKMCNKFFYASLLFAFYLSCHYVSVAAAQTQNYSTLLPLKAVNLGNWLVIEGWMKPSLFEGITNKDLLVGTLISITC